MKKLLILAAAAALLLASCAKVETTTKTVVDENVPIAFSNYAPRSITKAAAANYASGNVLIENATFGVYAWSTANGTSITATPGTPNFMNGTVVTYKGDTTDGDANTYSPVQFWPAGDTPDYLTFFSYYPQNGSGITPAINGASNIGTFAFTAQSTAATQVDFLVADVVPNQVYGNTNAGSSYKGTVKFTFKHQLAKIQFKFKKATGLESTTVIELLDAKLANINNTGTLTVSYAPATPATTTEWSSVSGAAGYEIFVSGVNPNYTPATNSDPAVIANPVKLTEDAAPADEQPADVFLMVPQTMETYAPATDPAVGQILNLVWRVRVYDTEANATANGGTPATGLVSETINSKTLSFKSDLVTSPTDDTSVQAINWVKNNFITYTITIGPKPIWFTATVGAWDAEQNGFFNVQ